MFLKTKKWVSMLIVFVIMFTYSGGTIEAIATTDGLSAITNGFSSSEDMELKSYFGDRENNSSENVSNVNEKAILMLEISPSKIGKGFLKKGTILASGIDGSDVNFKFSKIKNVTIEQVEDEVEYEEKEETEEPVYEDVEEMEEETFEDEIIEETEDVEVIEEKETEELEENTISENEVTTETTENVVENNSVTNETTNTTVENTTNTITNTSANISETNTSLNNIENNTSEVEDLLTSSNIVTSRAGEGREENEEQVEQTEELANEEQVNEEKIEETQDEFVDEEKIIEEKTEEEKAETYKELTAKDFEIEITKDNEITVQNVIYNTIIEVEIEYNQSEKINIADLYKEINLKLSGVYINTNLDVIDTEKNSTVTVGWEYNKDFDITGEYTQFSPFQLGTHEGIIVESKINVKRETEDEKYLPIKQTTIEVDVPDFNESQPETVSVQARKLMATKGEDVGEVTFSTDNWNYDEGSKKITITVNNEKDGTAINSMGEDEYVIVYRYSSYTEAETVNMDQRFLVSVEEYSCNNNIKTAKEFKNTQEIKTERNDLITYNINTTEDKISKAKINANYNQEEPAYETDFVSTVNVDVLTSDILEELKINSSKDMYVDGNNVEFDATQDIYYSKVKFNYNEIHSMLQNGAIIEIQSLAGELLYTLEDSLVNDQDDCEVRLESKEKGINVILKNVSTNGNIEIEFTKAIEKSNYDKATFNTYKAVKSYVSAELKYQSFDERYAMEEIATIKEMQDSQTVAELVMTNNNLSTTAKNDGVELRIVLNNDKQDTDLYVNPSFELVFPRYVSNVTLESIGLIYDCGLRIAGNEIYKEDGLVKMRIDLSGVQTNFSESQITNGSNIIINMNMELNEYTPKKQDQIKMYYYNEGVTNYESQTKWTIKKDIPNGIIKETNGFDVAIVNYQGMTGMVLSNAIINYDGQASKVKSVKQGERTVQVSTAGKEQIATMELVVMNNTENKCTDGVFIGRVATEDATNVITGAKLGTTVDTKMLGALTEATTNPNMATIYYSENANATRDLKDSKNNWKTNVTDFTKMKSYMIVVKGEMAEGALLRYTYDFEIPENLGYDAKICGNFGGYYNNNGQETVKYESAEADIVGLITECSPELKVTVSPYGGNKNLYYGQIVELVAKVENNTKEDIDNAILKVSVPTNTIYTESQYVEDGSDVVQKYVENKELKEKEFKIDHLTAGEIKNFSFEVKILENDKSEVRLDGYTQINETNQKYSLKAKPGDIAVSAEILANSGVYYENSEVVYAINMQNNTEDVLKDVKLEFAIPTYVTVEKIQKVRDGVSEKDLTYSNLNRMITVNIGDLEKEGYDLRVYFTIHDLKTEETTGRNIFNVYQANNENRKYSSNVLQFKAEKSFVEIEQSINSNELKYLDPFEYRAVIKNNSSIEDSIKIKAKLQENLVPEDTKVFIDGQEIEKNYSNEFEDKFKLSANGTIEIVLKGTVYYSGDEENADDSNAEISNTVTGELWKSKEKIESNELKIKLYDEQENSEIDEDNDEEYYEEDELEEQTEDEDLDYDEADLENGIEELKEGIEVTEDDEVVGEQNDKTIIEQEETTEENVEEDAEEDIEEDAEEDAEEVEENADYEIEGNVYVDGNLNGIRDEDEETVDTQVQVQLLKGKTMIKATTTDSNGNYNFSELKPGDYTVVFNYDAKQYTSTIYAENQTAQTSKSVEINEGTAVTDMIKVGDNSVENVDSGLQEKEKFDFKIDQYLSKSVVTINGNETVYDYDDVSLAKVEINPFDLKNASVKLNYKMVVTNTGNVAGQVNSIVDYIPNGMKFVEAENEGWSIGTINGNIYYDGLKDITLQPGETQEIVLVLNKDMTEDNTGIVGNKVQIAYVDGNTRLTEVKDNNFATQETIITITEGANKQVGTAITISVLAFIAIFGYMIKTEKITISFNLGKGIKKVYK